MPTPTVIDLSHWNPEPDYAKMKADGIKAVVLKATEGTKYVDPTFKKRQAAALAQGMPVFSYHFLKSTDVKAQMDHYVNTVKPVLGERMVIDFEDVDCDIGDLVDAVQHLKAKGLNLQITVYAGGHLKGIMNPSRSYPELSNTSLWLAQYGPKAKLGNLEAAWQDWTLWQYTDKETVDGLSKPVDANVFNGSDEALLRWVGPAGVEKPPVTGGMEPVEKPTPPPLTQSVVALAVAKGTVVTVTNGEQTWHLTT